MIATHPDTPAGAPPHLKSRARTRESVPETISQAIRWDAVKNQVISARYLREVCRAVRLGRQIGFA